MRIAWGKRWICDKEKWSKCLLAKQKYTEGQRQARSVSRNDICVLYLPIVRCAHQSAASQLQPVKRCPAKRHRLSSSIADRSKASTATSRRPRIQCLHFKLSIAVSSVLLPNHNHHIFSSITLRVNRNHGRQLDPQGASRQGVQDGTAYA